MSQFFVLWRRELFSFLVTPVAVIISVLFLAITGLVFWFMLSLQTQGPTQVPLVALMLGSPFVWILQLILPPVLTMRCFAEERRTGTLETLLTSPLSETTVVLAKYAAALTLYILLWSVTLLYLRTFALLNAEPTLLDPGAIAGGYGFIVLVGMLYIAIGVFASSITTHQMVAAITGFTLLALLFFAGFADLMVQDIRIQHIATFVSSHEHLHDFARGMIDTRPIIFHLSMTLFVLFATIKHLESRHWKV